MKLTFGAFVCALLSSSIAESGSPVVLARTSRGDEYGYMMHARPGPLAILFATDISESLGGLFTPIGLALVDRGYIVVALDLPCHGKDSPGILERTKSLIDSGRSAAGLDCWASRIAASREDIFTAFVGRVGRVISDLTDKRLVSGSRVAVIGISRGGYIALRVAIGDERVTDVVALAPVTDLGRLSEFAGKRFNASTYALDRGYSVLAKKHIFLQIGSNDDRVGTREVLHFAEGLVAAAGATTLDLTLIVSPIKGHGTAEHERAADWIFDQLSRSSETSAPPFAPPK